MAKASIVKESKESTVAQANAVTTVGSYEAKTQLPRLLERVVQGEQITITKHGVPVARLVPIPVPDRMSRQDAIAEMRTFGQTHRLNGLSLRAMIEEGRR